uniref:Uncharacterized protein n=1 Tax=Peronospora matthiolae TaxID=2874970 RepID=A0AAV1T0J9_9STRA
MASIEEKEEIADVNTSSDDVVSLRVSDRNDPQQSLTTQLSSHGSVRPVYVFLDHAAADGKGATIRINRGRVPFLLTFVCHAEDSSVLDERSSNPRSTSG